MTTTTTPPSGWDPASIPTPRHPIPGLPYQNSGETVPPWTRRRLILRMSSRVTTYGLLRRATTCLTKPVNLGLPWDKSPHSRTASASTSSPAGATARCATAMRTSSIPTTANSGVPTGSRTLRSTSDTGSSMSPRHRSATTSTSFSLLLGGEGPESSDGAFDLGQPYRFDTDYVLRGTAAKCGPGDREQTEPQTCEWFVHDFAEGIPAGRYDFWTGWYVPCSAWLDLGLVESCTNPDEVTWEFHGSVNTPIFGEDYTEGWFPGPFEPETLLSSPDEYWDPMVRGWPETDERTNTTPTGIDTGGAGDTARHPPDNTTGQPKTGINESEYRERP